MTWRACLLSLCEYFDLYDLFCNILPTRCQCYKTFFLHHWWRGPISWKPFPVGSWNLRARPEQTQSEDLSDASLLGTLLVLPANVRLDWKVIARYKHSSLFGLFFCNKKTFYNIDTRLYNNDNFLHGYNRQLKTLFLMYAYCSASKNNTNKTSVGLMYSFISIFLLYFYENLNLLKIWLIDKLLICSHPSSKTR